MLQNAGNRTEIYISDLYAYAVEKGNLSPLFLERQMGISKTIET